MLGKLIPNERSKQNCLDVLQKLGLTMRQAKLYYFLSERKEATARELAKICNTDRGETYRVLAQLCELGCAKKKLTYPRKFIAIPIKDLLEILIEEKKRQIDQIDRETVKLFHQFPNVKNGAIPKEKYTLVVPRVKMITQEIRSDNRNAKKRVDILTSIQDQIDIGYTEGKRGVETSLKNGVEIRLIIEKPQKPKSMPKHILELEQYPNFILRYIPKPSEHLLVIQDDKKAWIKMKVGGFYTSPWLVTNNPQIIVLARAFFNTILKDSTLANEMKT